jgi:acylphosphatase
MSRAFKVRIEGMVQGVGFRYYTEKEANRLGISGWVRNCADGSVETVICGSEDQLNAMLAWLKHGPPSASVSQTDIEPVEIEATPADFQITN